MEKLLDVSVPLKEMSPLALAFLGDGVFDLFVREFLVGQGNCPVKKLHARAVEVVKCEAQSRFIKEILLPIMTEEEQDVYRRGRNAKVNHVPKNAQLEDYHNATGLESLFGYLYLKGDIDRLREFFNKITAQL
ncbi:Mini-ribonuclease 3 [Scatolibacter rhodanostii]|uniref:Mini-ribonuclease 3 n=1 Tax=Scatolibacter rhodanostii TaxID=2014781 RepID=UPI00278BC0B4|nr:ribonuclease III domain-containing protein [Scatolibacter rhodanostii]